MSRSTTRFVAFCAGVGMMAFSALTMQHFFAANYPTSIFEGSFCDINAFFNCDSSASSPISAVAGVPIGWFGLMLGALGLLLMTAFDLQGIETLQQSLVRVESVFLWIRLILIVSLIGFWRPLHVGIARRYHWPEDRLVRVLHGRWLALGVLLFVELVLIQRWHEPLINRLVQ